MTLQADAHAHAVKFGFGDDGHVQNNLINVYLGFWVEVGARMVFGGMTMRGYGDMGVDDLWVCKDGAC